MFVDLLLFVWVTEFYGAAAAPLQQERKDFQKKSFGINKEGLAPRVPLWGSTQASPEKLLLVCVVGLLLALLLSLFLGGVSGVLSSREGNGTEGDTEAERDYE
jgi:hypothetical protein